MKSVWSTALMVTAEILNRNRIPWMLVGSAATALRGAAITPGDLDIAVNTADDLTRAANLMPTPSVEPQDTTPDWLSSQSAPTLSFGDAGEQWTFGRWIIEGFRVEIAHIESPRTTTLYLETRSTLSWSDREPLECAGHDVPTVRVEPQIATMIARDQTDRIDATLAAVGIETLDPSRLRRAINDKRTEAPDLVIPDQIRQVLAV
ncbi:hypothetical protein [Microlunatus soli]|nr:hypothetical protein [Microlunatus soli]